MITCVTGERLFEKGKTYPLYHIDGYAYILMLNILTLKPVFFALDSYEDDTYKYENAVFKEVI